MKKIKFLAFGLFSLMFAACSDVPDPYEDPTQGDLPYLSANLNSGWTTLASTAYTGENPWSQGASYTQATGYQDWDKTGKSNKEVSGALISPALKTNALSDSIIICFDYTIRYFEKVSGWEKNHKIFISNDYDGKNFESATWEEIAWTPVASPYSDWTLYSSGNIAIPTAYVNQKNVRIAFTFYAPKTASTTWELQNFEMKEGSATPKPVPSSDYLNQDFTVSQGDFAVKHISGTFTDVWTQSPSYGMTAKAYDGTAQIAESWLVSPEIDLTTATSPVMTISHAVNYLKGAAHDGILDVYVATDYTAGSAIDKSKWTKITVIGWPTADSYTFVDASADLSAYAGKKIFLAFQYASTAATEPTWEIKTVKVAEGSAPTPPPTPVDEGSGTYEDPYTVAGAQAHQSGNGYVKGYIVGYVPGQKLAEAVFGTSGTVVASNILIAKSADETDVNNCIPVQLINNSDVRTGINLLDHPEMYKKELLIYGSLEKYFGTAGLKTTTYAECDGKTFGTKPGEDPQPSGDGYYMDFKKTGSKGDWTIEDKTLPEELTYVWSFDSKYGMKASAFLNSTNYASESWLISPQIDLPAGVKTLTVHQALNFLNGNTHSDFVNIMVSSDKTNWTAVDMKSWPAGTGWTFEDDTADFSAYAGKKIYLAFKYTSSSTCAPTWEVEKLSIE